MMRTEAYLTSAVEPSASLIFLKWRSNLEMYTNIVFIAKCLPGHFLGPYPKLIKSRYSRGSIFSPSLVSQRSGLKWREHWIEGKYLRNGLFETWSYLKSAPSSRDSSSIFLSIITTRVPARIGLPSISQSRNAATGNTGPGRLSCEQTSQ